MEYLVGEPLSRVLAALARMPEDKPPAERVACFFARIVADACEGLHAAHELRDSGGNDLRVVHRDISHSNLVLTYDGFTKIVDFGIATSVIQSHESITGQVRGKLGYLAPELLRGERADRRADVWALGVVLWELLTRARLFPADTPGDVILALAKKLVVPPSKVRPGIPPELDAVVMGALERDREKRYPTAREMGRGLNALLGQTGRAVAPTDLADFMQELFRDRRAQQLEFARHATTSREVVAAPTPVNEPTRPDAQPRGSRVRLLALLGAAALAAIIVSIVALRGGRDEPAAGTPNAATGPRPIPTQPSAPTAPVAEVVPPSPPEPDPAATAPAPETAPPPALTPPPAPTRQVGSKRDKRPPVEPPRGRGRVSVLSPGGWATVEENSRALGQTPLQVELPAGRHTLVLRRAGTGRPVRVPVNVVANSLVTVRPSVR